MLLGLYYIRGCLAGAVEQGFDPEHLLEQAGIDPSAYTDRHASIDGIQFQRLILAVCDTLNDEYLGYFRTQGKRKMARLAAQAALRGDTLRQALRSLCEFVNAVRNDIRLDCLVDETTNEALVCSRISGIRDSVDPHLLHWVKIYWVYKFQCWLVGQRIKLTRVCFTASKPVEAADGATLFDCDVEYRSATDGFGFSSKYLDCPVVRTEMDTLESFFSDDPDWFSIPQLDRTLSRRVENLLVRLYSNDANVPTLESVASELSMSPRTVTRKLKTENVTFQHIKDSVRLKLANTLLESTDLPVSNIATRVGFWVPSDFTRAYVRWTGLTPSDYRAGAQARTQHVRAE